MKICSCVDLHPKQNLIIDLQAKRVINTVIFCPNSWTNKLLNLPTPAQFPPLRSCFGLDLMGVGNKTDYMPQDPQDGRSRNYILMRTLMDIGMGIIYIGVALFILLAPKFGMTSPIFDAPFNYFFAGICIAYGIFRIYRGVKKNYFRS